VTFTCRTTNYSRKFRDTAEKQ